MRHECFIQGVLGEQVVELADQVSMPTQLQFAPDSLQRGCPSFLFQAMPHTGDPFALDPSQCLAAPKPVRGTEQSSSVAVIATRGQSVRLLAQPTELMQVDRLRIDLKYIAARPRYQLYVVTHCMPQ